MRIETLYALPTLRDIRNHVVLRADCLRAKPKVERYGHLSPKIGSEGGVPSFFGADSGCGLPRPTSTWTTCAMLSNLDCSRSRNEDKGDACSLALLAVCNGSAVFAQADFTSMSEPLQDKAVSFVAQVKKFVWQRNFARFFAKRICLVEVADRLYRYARIEAHPREAEIPGNDLWTEGRRCSVTCKYARVAGK
jgi:hypothetical protein